MIYLDSSFVTSLYGPDANSAAAESAMRASAGEMYVLTSLAELETVNAFFLHAFRKESTRVQADACTRIFDDDLQRGLFLRRPIPQSAFERARTLSLRTTARLGTRTADLLHVAAALEFGATSLFSFDVRQRNIALEASLALNPMP